METLKKIVRNQYFPAAAVLTAVLVFWIIAMFGGLSLLNNNQPPMATLTWMLFVYAAAVLTPLAGFLAGTDLVRRWRRNRLHVLADPAQDEADGQEQEPATQAPAQARPADPEAPEQSVRKRPEQHRPVSQHQPLKQAVQQQPPTQQAAKKPRAQTKQRKKAA